MNSPTAPVLSVVVTAHREGRLLKPTLRSIDAAVDLVRREHGDVQVIIVCDNADEQTLDQARAWVVAREGAGVGAGIIEVSLGESGAARNAGAEVAAGGFVAFVDGDDLISARFLSDAVSRLSQDDSPAVMHPETVLSFGARSLLWRVDSARSSEIDYRDLLRHNLWPSCAVMRRTTARSHPYLSFPPEGGFGPEDWIWNIATTAAGVIHDTVPDSVFFYRVRASGGVNDRHTGSLLPPFDLDALRGALPLRADADADAPSSRAGIHGLYAKALPLARRSTWWMSYEARNVLYRGARAAYRLARRGNGPGLGEHSTPAPVQEALHAACELDPSISWAAHDFARLPYWHPRDDGYGAMLDQTLTRIGERAGAVVAAPWVGIGGADFVALNYARGLQASDRFRDRTVILGTFLGERTVHENIPGDILYHHLPAPWLEMQPHLRRRFVAQLLVLLAPELVVSVSSFHVTEALQDYAAQVTAHSRVFATLFAFDRLEAGYPVNPITDDAQRRYLDSMSGIITDNTTTARLVDDILALPRNRIIVQRQPVSLETPELVRATRAYHNRYFSKANPFRLIWPHRLDEEKRPDTVVAIAQELRRRGVPAVIDVWGQRVLTGGGVGLMQQMQDAGVVYRGPYTGGLTTLPTHEYHALLLTSQSEGLPLVLVQSLLNGLPVIASAVGGVPDIIVDDETGLLVTGPDDIDGFADAIERLIRSLDLRRSLIERGYERTVSLHSWGTFRKEIDAQFSAGAAVPSS